MRLHSYLARLIWVCIAPLLLLSAFFAVRDVLDLRASSLRDGQDFAHNAAGAIDRQIGFRVAAMRMMAEDEHLADPASGGEVYRDAQSFERMFGAHLLLADLSGQMLWNTRLPYGSPLPKLPEVQGTSAAAVALATGQPAVSDLFIGPVAKRP